MREGSLEAPSRHVIRWQDPDFADRELHLFQLANFDRAGKIFPAHGKEGQLHLGRENRGESFARALRKYVTSAPYGGFLAEKSRWPRLPSFSHIS